MKEKEIENKKTFIGNNDTVSTTGINKVHVPAFHENTDNKKIAENKMLLHDYLHDNNTKLFKIFVPEGLLGLKVHVCLVLMLQITFMNC